MGWDIGSQTFFCRGVGGVLETVIYTYYLYILYKENNSHPPIGYIFTYNQGTKSKKTREGVIFSTSQTPCQTPFSSQICVEKSQSYVCSGESLFLQRKFLFQNQSLSLPKGILIEFSWFHFITLYTPYF